MGELPEAGASETAVLELTGPEQQVGDEVPRDFDVALASSFIGGLLTKAAVAARTASRVLFTPSTVETKMRAHNGKVVQRYGRPVRPL